MPRCRPSGLMWIYVTHLALGLDRFAIYAAGAPIHTISALLLALVLTPELGVEGAMVALAASHAVSAIVVVLWSRRERAARRRGGFRAPARILAKQSGSV